MGLQPRNRGRATYWPPPAPRKRTGGGGGGGAAACPKDTRSAYVRTAGQDGGVWAARRALLTGPGNVSRGDVPVAAPSPGASARNRPLPRLPALQARHAQQNA
jgi:hypothetical protein